MVINPFMPTGAFNICCLRDCVSLHNGSTAGAPLKPLRDDSALRALSSLRGLRGLPLCRETLVSRTANFGTVGENWLRNTDEEACAWLLQLLNRLLEETKKIVNVFMSLLIHYRNNVSMSLLIHSGNNVFRSLLIHYRNNVFMSLSIHYRNKVFI